MFAAAPGWPFPFSTTSGTSFGLGADFVFFRLPGSTWSVAFWGASTSGCANSAIAVSMFEVAVVSSFAPVSPPSLTWKKLPAGIS